jgi:AAHS family benzoate transporter-like MFS transporter
MIGGWVLESNLGLQWNFYAFAIPAVIAAVIVMLIPKATQSAVSYAADMTTS